MDIQSTAHDTATTACVPEDDQFIDTKVAAQIVPLSESTLNKARCTGDGPPFYKIGARVLYSKRELIQWLQSHKRLSTSAAA